MRERERERERERGRVVLSKNLQVIITFWQGIAPTFKNAFVHSGKGLVAGLSCPIFRTEARIAFLDHAHV